MSNKLYQNAISQFCDIIGEREIGVVDGNSSVIAHSDIEKIGSRGDFFSDLGESSEVFIRDGFTYKPFGSPSKPEYAVLVKGEDSQAENFATMIAVSLNLVKQYYDDKFDRTNFIKNVILNNVIPGEIGIKVRELHLNADINRVAFLISTSSTGDISPFEILQNLFPDKNKDFIFNINENDIVLIKEIKNNTEIGDLEKLARSISETLMAELFEKVTIGIGNPVIGIKDLAESFKNAQMAIEVGKVFDTEKSIISYSNLGIARLICHVPDKLCEAFLGEVFKKGSIESLDYETLFTIQRFFENNLNVSETSRRLFVHRNTLVYRLDKIKKLTGLDLREFEHAIIFKIALMVKKYIANKPMKI